MISYLLKILSHFHAFKGLEWRGPIPDPESFKPAKMAPDYTQKELFEELEHIGAIKTDFSIPADTPTSQPKQPK